MDCTRDMAMTNFHYTLSREAEDEEEASNFALFKVSAHCITLNCRGKEQSSEHCKVVAVNTNDFPFFPLLFVLLALCLLSIAHNFPSMRASCRSMEVLAFWCMSAVASKPLCIVLCATRGETRDTNSHGVEMKILRC